MKRTLLFILAPGLVLAGLSMLAGCGKNETPATGPQQKVATNALAQHTSFDQVTAQLEPGGNLYLYLSTEEWVNHLSSKVANWRGLAENLPNVTADDRSKIGSVFDVLTNVIKDSGIEDVSGFGISSVEREKRFYHTKALLHHYPGKGTGFLWSVCGQKPHNFESQDFLPASTALASFSDLDVSLAWSVLEKEISQSGLPDAEELLRKLPSNFETRTGLKWDKVIASLGGEFGLVVTLDDSRKVALPLPASDGPFEVPEPALMLMARVKDDTIFDRIDEALKQKGQSVVSTDKPGLRMRTVPVPLPLPIQLRPSVASSGGYLFIATTDALIQEALAVKAGQKPGLKATAEFKRLSADVPAEGNHFSFLSQRLADTVRQIQKAALPMVAKSQGNQLDWLQPFINSTNASFSYAVSGCTSEGWLAVCNGSQHPAKMFLTAGAVPIGIVSGIAIPNFIKARATAQKNACISNLRQLEAAKMQWALDNQKPETATPARGDLLQYLNKRKFPVCPAGGTYTLNDVSESPTCSWPGHYLSK
jgi:hypothetical protein